MLTLYNHYHKINRDKIRIINKPETIILALEERGFFAALDRKGKAISKESRNIEDVCHLVKSSSVIWVDYILDDLKKEAHYIATSLGFSESLIRTIVKSTRSGYEDFGNEMGIMLPAIIVEGLEVKLEPLIILIKENIIVTLHTTEIKRFFRLRRYAETLMRKLPIKGPKKDKITMLLIRIIDENNARNFDHLIEIEEQGDKLSESLSDPKTPRLILGHQIYKMKHALIAYLGGLWAIVDALNSLRYGDADLLTDNKEILVKINALISEVNSQIGLAEHLSEVLVSGLEVMQSIYNNQLQILNNRLAMLIAYLTIIGTALLVPNTIATIVSGSMFEFTPADQSWYLPLLVGSTIIATIFAWLFVKKMGWLPENTDR